MKNAFQWWNWYYEITNLIQNKSQLNKSWSCCLFSNKRKCLRNSSLRLLIPCECAILWRTYWFYWTLFKKWQTQIYGMRLKKERHKLVLRYRGYSSRIFGRALNTPLMNEINFLVIIIIIIITIIIIIIINIDSGSIYKYSGSSPYKLKKI